MRNRRGVAESPSQRLSRCDTRVMRRCGRQTLERVPGLPSARSHALMSVFVRNADAQLTDTAGTYRELESRKDGQDAAQQDRYHPAVARGWQESPGVHESQLAARGYHRLTNKGLTLAQASELRTRIVKDQGRRGPDPIQWTVSLS